MRTPKRRRFTPTEVARDAFLQDAVWAQRMKDEEEEEKTIQNRLTQKSRTD